MTRSKIPDLAGSNIPDKAGRKTKRTQATAKRYAFHANAITFFNVSKKSFQNKQ